MYILTNNKMLAQNAQRREVVIDIEDDEDDEILTIYAKDREFLDIEDNEMLPIREKDKDFIEKFLEIVDNTMVCIAKKAIIVIDWGYYKIWPSEHYVPTENQMTFEYGSSL